MSKIDFNGIADLTNLSASIEIVEISNNPTVNIISLKNSSIKILSAQNCCNLESLDIENNSSLETLNFSNCKVNENSFLISNCENLKSLIFSRNEFLRFDYDEKILPNLSELVCSPQIKIFQSPTDFINNSPNITNLNVNDSIITYDYITGFNDVKMNVIIILDVDSEYDFDKNNSAGCSVINVGKLAIIMTLNLIFMFLRKKENFYGRCSSFSNGVSRKNRQG